MKTIRLSNHVISRAVGTVFLLTVLLGCHTAKSEPGSDTVTAPEQPVAASKDQRILLALLLDTSNSMDGLIDQAKSQLWRIVNELARAQCDDGNRPSISIALYEYGNDGLNAADGYIRMVSPFTSDLDVISEKLFALRTNGGSEYCGHVINKSLHQLVWSTSDADLKMIFIAGNEPFTQGEIPYQAACKLAREKGVVVNTIFCGNFDEGIRTQWKDGADVANGTYMSIDHNRKTVYIPSPYDDKIAELNDRLNSTYVYYGRSGQSKKESQLAQDDNAAQYGQANKVERALSKSSHAYKNSTWDLVDAAKENDKAVEEAEEAYLPKEMKSMTVEQRKSYVVQKAHEREQVQKELQSLNEKRSKYLAEHAREQSGQQSLDEVMFRSIHEKGKEKNLRW